MQQQVIQTGVHGLISIWHEGDGIGIRGNAYDAKEKGYIELDPDTKKLKIKRGWTNNAYTFDVDGWSGRYGMPLEFLLSVHIATQMPDLAIEMSVTFDTDVEVLLRSIENGEIVAGVLKSGASKNSTNDSDYITYKQLEDIGKQHNGFFDNLWNGINGLISWLGFWKEEDHKALTLDDQACYVLFAYGMPHSKDCTCCEHIPGRRSTSTGCEGEEDIMPEDATIDNVNIDDIKLDGHEVCDVCQDRVTKISAALKVVNDKKWESYTPYISKVTNHWFRDVYFVINSSESGEDAADERKGINAVQVDDLYYYETGERWTVYETWKAGETIPGDFEVDDYKLYEYDPSKTGDGWENGYKLFEGTKADVEERNKKIMEGDTSVSRLVKKPVTEHKTDFNAYKAEGDQTIDWTQMAISGDSKGELQEDMIYEKEFYDTDNPNNNDDMLIYYKETRPGDIKQIEDGIRAETNPKIKEMFVNKAYYKYTGDISRANLIYEDRKKTNREKDNTAEDERDPKLISKVSLIKDSLGAFSMLENTHSLDADYVYRDFKELIVELDYFDKEELSDKIQEVMQWIIPECGSAGWPVRKYEKGTVFYGTLINSKIDLEMMRNKDIEAAKKMLEELKDEVEEEGEAKKAPVGTSKVPAGSVATLVQTGYDVHAVMEGNNWDYCVKRPADCTHKYGHACGLDSTIDAAIANYHNTCCATYISWVLQKAGFDLSGHPGIHSATGTYKWCEASNWTPITDYAELEPGDLLFNKYGYEGTDVSNIGHVQMLGNDGQWLNAGSVEAINDPPKAYDTSFIIGMRSKMNGAAKQFEGYEADQAVVAPITGKITEYGTVNRKNEETGKEEEVEFIKIQAMDHCLYDVDEDAVNNKEELMKNQSKNQKKHKRPIDQGKAFKKAVNADGTFNEYDPDVQSDLEGYDYFYEEYSGICDGYVLYIEGFDLTLFDADGSKAKFDAGEKDSGEVTQYESNEVYSMANDTEEAYALWKEDAKTYAAPFVQVGEDLYIKEGTVIGKTLEDPELGEDVTEEDLEKGNGNYIRLIFRDLEDSIVEDVESYFNIEDGALVSTAQPYQAQEGELELLAALICHEGGAPYWMNCHNFDESTAMAAGEAVGYVCINRALTNYGNFGTTITEQINAPGQYEKAEILAEYPYCEKCLEAAEWCLKYDCMSIKNPSGEPMTRDVQGQSGWEQCKTDGNCWWWIDTTGDGQRTEYSGKDAEGKVKPYDTFFCRNGKEG